MRSVLKTVASLLAVFVVGILLAYMFGVFFIVPETHSVVLKRFGDIRRVVVPGFYQGPGSKGKKPQINYMKNKYGGDKSPIEVSVGAGLYFKPPWWNAFYFETRILDWDGKRKEISTKDLRTLSVDASARWRILDPVQFYRAAGANEFQAQARLDSVINSQVEDEISNTRLIEVVRNERLRLQQKVKKQLKTVGKEEAKSAEIRYGRQELVRAIQTQAAKELLERFGVRLVDVLLTRINYTQSVRKQVYDRMISERKRIAARYRAQGEKARKKILGEVQRKKDELLSNAERRVQEILGRAEARSIKIQAEAHKKNPSFYRFRRSLKAYKEGLDTTATLIFSDENKLLEYTTKTP